MNRFQAKNIIFLFFYLGFYFSCSAQEIKTTWGNDLSLEYVVRKWELLGKYESGIDIVELRSEGNFSLNYTVVLRRLNESTLQTTKELTLFSNKNDSNDGYIFAKCVRTNNVIFLFAFKIIKNETQLYVQKYNSDGSLISAFEKVLNANLIVPSTSSAKLNHDKLFDIFSNPEKGVFIGIYTLSSDEKSKSIKCITLDKNGILNTNLQFNMPVTGKDCGIEKMQYDFNSKLYIFDRYTDKNLKGNQQSHYEISSLNLKNNKSNAQKITLSNQYIEHLSFTLDKQNTLIATGLYSNAGNNDNENGIQGYFTFRLNNETDKIENLIANNFTPDIIETLSGKSAAKKNKGLSLYFLVKNMATDNNGNLFVAFEKTYTVLFNKQYIHQSNALIYLTLNNKFEKIVCVPYDRKDIAGDYFSRKNPYHTILFTNKASFIFQSVYRFELSSLGMSTDEPIKYMPVSIFTKDGKLLENKKVEFQIGEKKRRYFINLESAQYLEDGQAIFYANAYKDAFSESNPIKIPKKYVKIEVK